MCLFHSPFKGNRLFICILISGVLLLFGGCADDGVEDTGKQSVVIGAVMPLSGEMAKFGKTSLAALQTAIEDANSKSDSYVFKLVAEDDQLTPSVGASATRKLLDVDRSRLIIGAWPSSVTAAIIPITDAADAVLVSPASSAPNLKSSKGLFFRTCVSDTIEGRVAVEYATRTLGAKRLAVLYIRNDWGQGLLEAFRRNVEAAGAEVVLAEGFEMDTADFRVALTKVRSQNPDVTYIVAYKEMVTLFKQARDMDLKQQWLSTTILNDQSIVDQTEGAAEGTILASWDFSPDMSDQRFQDFRTQVKEKTDELEVDVFAANAYDAAWAVTRAVEEVGTSVQAVAAFFKNGNVVHGIWGDFHFDPNCEVERKVVLKKIVDGRLRDLDSL
jgi:branched-chain amino acid transport system substrate-binding protein